MEGNVRETTRGKREESGRKTRGKRGKGKRRKEKKKIENVRHIMIL
jgi:hypothetical protein